MRSSPRLVRKPRPNRVFRGDQELEPLAVFPPDARKFYFDTSYPWRAVCRVTTNNKSGSGVLIGRRHVLTASHLMPWNIPAKDRLVSVTAHLYDNFGLGTTTAFKILSWTKMTSVTFSTVDEDYVVLVLRAPLGEQIGAWLGYRTYDSSWDGKPWWKSIGYTSDLGQSDRPIYQGDFKLDEDDLDLGPARAMTTADGDFMPGQSGSPVFTWFKNSKWPKVVGVASAAEPDGSANYMAGGTWLSELITTARTNYP